MPETKLEARWNEWAMKALEELTDLNAKYGQLEKSLETQTEDITARISAVERSLAERISRVEVAVTGNGSPERGLQIKVDRIEQNEKRREWWSKTAIGFSFTALMTALKIYFGK